MKDKILLTIKYNFFGKLLLIIFSLFGMFIGSIFIIAINNNIFFITLGCLIVLYCLIMFSDILFFKRMDITDKYIIKNWLFGKYYLPINDAYVSKTSYQINRGTIRFKSKNNRFLSFILPIYLLALSDYEKSMLKIKKVFINLELLKGDEYEWNN